MQGDRDDFAGSVQYRHATLAEFAQVFGLEDQVPGINRRIRPKNCPDLVHVITHPRGAPQVRHGIAITRIVTLHLGQDVRSKVRAIGQLRRVQFLKDPGLDQVGQQIPGGHDDVIAIAPLTAREMEVGLLLLSGCSNKGIARKLVISAETVKVHRKHMYSKLGIKSQSERFSLFLQAQE